MISLKKLNWVIVLIVAVLIVIFLPGLSRYHQLKARQARLNNGIEKLRASEVGLRKEQDKLQKDPTYIEKVARDKLQVINKGETIVRVEGRDGK
ncbi:MAG: septum formation initiator family protein [Candidatus Omnitrophota bacterium]|nr:septum formation initiator family protein [Candidatus Omnitrophota bacterium]MDP3786316.1 septum formation initiator family protein [Candidatus Omnitrophota bacterium]